MQTTSIPMPPIELRTLAGPVDEAFYDNPSGDAIFDRFWDLDYSSVVDLGCGGGRLARQLIQQRVRPKRYVGIDVNAEAVAWCSRSLSTVDPTFEFVHLDIDNPANPGGQKVPFVALPASDSSASLLIAWSVFTHIPEPDTLNYLREVRRVLRDDGAALITWYLFERSSIPWLPESLHTLYIAPDNPTAAVLVERDWLQELCDSVGLTVTHTVGPESTGGQLITILEPSGPAKAAAPLPGGSRLFSPVGPSDAEGGESLPRSDAASQLKRVIGLVRHPVTAGVGDAIHLDEIAAIEDYCGKRSWKLMKVVVLPEDESQLAREVGPLESALALGNADVLLAATGAVLSTQRGPLFRTAIDHDRAIVLIDELLDMTTPVGRGLAVEQLTPPAEPMIDPPPTSFPLPPPQLSYRSRGSTSLDGFESTGYTNLQKLETVLQSAGSSFTNCHRVFDFGCGCGRITRHLISSYPEIEVVAADADREAIEWVAANLFPLETHIARPLPPLDMDAAYVDVAIAFSVFTHLSEPYQDAWLAELSRIVRPGGFALLTVMSDRAWERHRSGPLFALPELAKLASDRSEHGFAFWANDGWSAHFADFYHTTFHTKDYIERHWSRWFEIIEIVPGGIYHDQDIVLARAR